MPNCVFVSDLHGRRPRYEALWAIMTAERPAGVFLGGDLLPHHMDGGWRRDGSERSFIADVLEAGFARVRDVLGAAYPEVFLIPGNDDPHAGHDHAPGEHPEDEGADAHDDEHGE